MVSFARKTQRRIQSREKPYAILHVFFITKNSIHSLCSGYPHIRGHGNKTWEEKLWFWLPVIRPSDLVVMPLWQQDMICWHNIASWSIHTEYFTFFNSFFVFIFVFFFFSFRGLATGNVSRTRLRAEVKKEILTGIFCSIAVAILLGTIGLIRVERLDLLIDSLSDWLTNWLFDWSFDSFIHPSIHPFIHPFIHRFMDWLIEKILLKPSAYFLRV